MLPAPDPPREFLAVGQLDGVEDGVYLVRQAPFGFDDVHLNISAREETCKKNLKICSP